MIDKQNIPADVSTYIDSLENKNRSLTDIIKILEAELHLERIKRFGNSSEKVTPLQPDFFEEDEITLDESSDEEDAVITVPAHNRKKIGRKAIDPSYPRQRIVHDIPEEEKRCGCGADLSIIEEVTSERLQVIPEKVYVEEHVRLKYACRTCEGSGDEDKPTFRISPAPKSLIPGSIMTGGLLSYILVNKFADYLPFYRQAKRFERLGMPISRQNMSNWTIKAYEKLKFLNDLMRKQIKSGTYLQMDETTVKVHGEEGKLDSSNSYIWVTRGGPPGSGVALYEYNKSRSSEYIKKFTQAFSGFVQSDGYTAYDKIFRDNDAITHVGCMAHARRKLYDAYKASKQVKKSNIIINKIQRIYNVERTLRKQLLTADEFLIKRKEQVEPLLESIKSWLDKKVLVIRPSSGLGKAVKYTLGQWNKIINYLDCPYLTPDNNAAERVVKPFVMGRKNFLFAGSTLGADAMCFFYSLIETAKLNGLNPYAYLKWLFETAPLLTDENKFETLAPWNCDPQEINKIMLQG